MNFEVRVRKSSKRYIKDLARLLPVVGDTVYLWSEFLDQGPVVKLPGEVSEIIFCDNDPEWNERVDRQRQYEDDYFDKQDEARRKRIKGKNWIPINCDNYNAYY